MYQIRAGMCLVDMYLVDMYEAGMYQAGMWFSKLKEPPKRTSLSNFVIVANMDVT